MHAHGVRVNLNGDGIAKADHFLPQTAIYHCYGAYKEKQRPRVNQRRCLNR